MIHPDWTEQEKEHFLRLQIQRGEKIGQAIQELSEGFQDLIAEMTPAEAVGVLRLVLVRLERQLTDAPMEQFEETVQDMLRRMTERN